MANFPDYLTFPNYRATNHDKQLKKVRKRNRRNCTGGNGIYRISVLIPGQKRE